MTTDSTIIVVQLHTERAIDYFYKPTPEFKLFWDAFPYRLGDRGDMKKPGKSKCLTFEEKRPHRIRHYFAEAMAAVGIEELCEAARMYGMSTEPRFVRYAHRWLRDGDYDTEYATGEVNYSDL